MTGEEVPEGSENGLAASLRERGAAWIYGIVVLGVLGALLVSVRAVLSPFVLYLLFLYLVWPLADTGVRVRLALGATAVLLLWIVHVTGSLLAPFVLAFILAYILDPLVDRLQRPRVPRSAAIALLILPLGGLLALTVLVLAPAVGHQVSQLIGNVPEYVHAAEGWLRSVRSWLIGLDIAGLNQQTIPQLGDLDAGTVVGYLRQWQSELTATGKEAVLGLGRGLGTVLTILGYVVLTPILTYYLLRDWDRLRDQIAGLLPRDHRERATSFAAEFDQLLSRYLRGQLLLALIVGTFIGVGFWLVDFPYALLLGIVAAVLNFVPYLGFAASALVASVIALFSGAVIASFLKIALVLGLEQVMEGFLGPVVVGESVGLHPVWVILALALFGSFFGFVGLLVAVPVAVLIKLVLTRAVGRYRRSRYYGGSSGR